MSSFKQLKTPKFGVVLQVTEVAGDAREARVWEVHDVERSRGFHVTLPSGELRAKPAKAKPLGRAFTEEEIEGAIGVAIERALTTPPEKVPGPTYEVAMTSQDLYDYLAQQG